MHFHDTKTVTILGYLSTGGTTTIWTLEGPGKTKDYGGWRSRNRTERRRGGEFETFLRSLLLSLVGVYASGNELQRGQAADWLESDGCLCWPERLLLQPLLLSLSNTRAPATLTCTYCSWQWLMSFAVYMQLYKPVLENPRTDETMNKSNTCLCLPELHEEEHRYN